MIPMSELTSTLTDTGLDIPQGQWTVADWEKLPEDGIRYEIIEGVLFMTTAPSNFHQWVITALARYIGVPAIEKKLGVWFSAPIGLILSPLTAMQPDFLFIRSSNLHIIRGGRLRGAPDLVIEVLSPGNTAKEMQSKRNAFATYGIPEYAVVKPVSRTLHYYRLESPGQYADEQHFSESDTVTFDCLPTLPLIVANLFADAPDTTIHVED